MNKAKIIVITNQKGGCGKTTVTIHLAAALSKRNLQVLVVDADPQHTATNWAKNKDKFHFTTTILGKDQQVNRVVQINLEKYDFILVDCPPSFDSIQTMSALLVGDIAIIPLLCSANDLWALQKIDSSIKDAKKINSRLRSHILINQYKPRELLTQGIIAAVEDFGISILVSKLGSRNAFKESAAYGLTVYNLKDNKAIDEIEKVTEEVLRLLEN